MIAKDPGLTKDAKERWIKDTQLFQKIVGTTVSSDEELSSDWGSFNTRQKKFHSANAETHRIIITQKVDRKN